MWFLKLQLPTGSATRSGNGAEDRHVPGERNRSTNEQRTTQGIGAMHISKDGYAAGMPGGHSEYPDKFHIFLSLIAMLLIGLRFL